MPVEYILKVHNGNSTLNEAASYNARIQCHHIAYNLKIRLDNLSEVNNGFTWMKCFTEVCRRMAIAVIIKYVIV